MFLQWKMKELVAMNKKNANFKIKIVVWDNVMTKGVMVGSHEKPKAGVYKIQILKEKVIPNVRVMWTQCRGGDELGNTQFITVPLEKLFPLLFEYWYEDLGFFKQMYSLWAPWSFSWKSEL